MRRKVGFNSPADCRGNPGTGTACFKDLEQFVGHYQSVRGWFMLLRMFSGSLK